MVEYVGQRNGQTRQQRGGQGIISGQHGPLDVLTIPQLKLRNGVISGVYGPVFQDARLGVYLPLAHQVAATVGGKYLDGDVWRGFNTASAYNLLTLIKNNNNIRLR